MSTVSPEADFDFFEFVACARCRMPFVLDNGQATIPFWLSDCGHILCNSHLSPDQTCAQCGAQDIQLVPLQREMDTFAEHFQSIPLALQSISYAAKFQQDTMATQVRHYRSRHQQLRQLVERLKRDVTEENDGLRNENEQYRQRFQPSAHDSQYTMNNNGKRQMVYSHYNTGEGNRPRTGSSSRSAHTPLAPNRLTLQPGQAVPELSSHSHDQRQRPVSRSLEHYAYKPAENNKYHSTALTHEQTASRAFQRTENFQQSRPQQVPQQMKEVPQQPQLPQMPPPSSRFKPPALSASSSTSQFNSLIRQPSFQNRKPIVMGPPPTPQASHIFPPRNSARRSVNQPYAPPPSRQQSGTALTDLSTAQRPQSTAAPQRFFPSK
ncbi:hypothetical protein CPB83DRAFT_436584 [Crepidotus variabilis]|uniref:RING-type domain-containing protein n=1 Tax=Crepidotus variabilis TaxID=179855 RepID=A0A9P6EDG6_9AGAR|nr:hypothetical protein CPB83DRAFT_436584 [Crepidotus variabilis]